MKPLRIAPAFCSIVVAPMSFSLEDPFLANCIVCIVSPPNSSYLVDEERLMVAATLNVPSTPDTDLEHLAFGSVAFNESRPN